MAITGTGTQADPFTFDPTGMTADEVWADFKGCLAKSGSVDTGYYKYCSLPEDYILDFNDVHDTVSMIPININIIKGNGFTVKNISSESTLFTISNVPHIIYDLSFLNMYGYSFLDTRQSTQTAFYMYFYGCVFTGIFTTSKYVIGNEENLTANRTYYIFDESPYSRKGCGINIECSNGDFIVSGKTSPNCGIYNSHVIFKGKHFTWSNGAHASISSSGSSSGDNVSDYIRSKNSLIEGEFDYLFLAGGTNSSVINVEMDSTDGKLYCANTSSGNIYNSDKATLTYAQPNAQLIGVTSEQMRDAQYLESIGFPIGVD